MDSWNFYSQTKARVDFIFADVRGEVRLTNAGDEGQPRGDFEFVVKEELLEASGDRSRRGRGSLDCRS